MSDLAAFYHWSPDVMLNMDWADLCAFREDLPRVIKVLSPQE